MSGTDSGRAERLGADILGMERVEQLPKWSLLDVMVLPYITGTLIILPN